MFLENCLACGSDAVLSCEIFECCHVVGFMQSGMDSLLPGLLAQFLHRRTAAEIRIERLLQAEVVNGHDREPIGHRSHSAGFLHNAFETQFEAAQLGAAQSPPRATKPLRISTALWRCSHRATGNLLMIGPVSARDV